MDHRFITLVAAQAPLTVPVARPVRGRNSSAGHPAHHLPAATAPVTPSLTECEIRRIVQKRVTLRHGQIVGLGVTRIEEASE